MIRSFRCAETQAIFEGRRSRRFGNLQNIIERKLFMLNNAIVLSDLKSPPNNQLEALDEDRVGQHSIRVNKQFRLCFRWTPTGPTEVEVVDYH